MSPLDSPDVLVSYYSMLKHVRMYPWPQTYLFYITQCSLMSERINIPRCPCFLLLNAHPCQSIPMSLDVLVFYYPMLTHLFLRIWCCHWSSVTIYFSDTLNPIYMVAFKLHCTSSVLYSFIISSLKLALYLAFCGNVRFSICIKAKVQMSSGTKIMLTLFSLCYIALASTCQRKNFTYFHQKNNTPRLVPSIHWILKELR